MIVKTRNHGNRYVESRNLTGLAEILSSRGMDVRGSSSSSVTEEKLVGLPAANLALRIASTAVAELDLGVFRGTDEDRRRVKTTWQSRFFEGMPNAYEGWSLLLEQTEAALTGRWSAFWRLDLQSGRVVGAHFLHSDAVSARWSTTEDRPEYRYRVVGGEWSPWTTVGVLHFRVGYPSPGCIIPPTPVEVARDSLGAMLAKPLHARQTFEKGAPMQIAATFPETVTPEQAELYRKALAPRMEGVAAAGGVRVFGGGMKIDTVGMSLADAQWVEAMQLDGEQIGQLFGVMPSLLGVMKNDRPLSPEHEETRWDRYYLGPRRTRIESAIRTHPAFFGPGSRDYPRLVGSPIRGDVKTQAAAVVSLVQAGIYTPDEGRAELGKAELPDGVGKIVQVTPVGGAPNPIGYDPIVVDENGDPVG